VDSTQSALNVIEGGLRIQSQGAGAVLRASPKKTLILLGHAGRVKMTCLTRIQSGLNDSYHFELGARALTCVICFSVENDFTLTNICSYFCELEILPRTVSCSL